MRNQRPEVLVVCDLFLPGYKGGGPIRTLANLLDHCRDRFRFRVVTNDRDHLDTAPYPGIEPDRWLDAYGCQVMYLSPARRSARSLTRLIRATPHDVLYLNSFFSVSTIKLLALRRLGLIPRRPLVLAPRGQFSPEALALKRLKKSAYLGLARYAGLAAGVLWQATSEAEREHILARFRAPVFLAPNLPGRPGPALPPPAKRPGRADFVFISRLAAVKNLDFALELLARAGGEATLDIFGPIEDPGHWKECSDLIAGLPGNAKVCYRGRLRHEEVAAEFSRHHFFLFPTRSENFGHVVLEALCAGCPVIVSDRTPWRGLERHRAGWDIPLENPDRFLSVLERCIAMDAAEYAELSAATREYGRKLLEDDRAVRLNRELFEAALGRARGGAEAGSKAGWACCRVSRSAVVWRNGR